KTDLLNIEGIGKVKYEKYGDTLLAIIRGYMSEQDEVKNVKGQRCSLLQQRFGNRGFWY
nr:HRDC domain-containing protein [Saprospiraceae bacterium]